MRQDHDAGHEARRLRPRRDKRHQRQLLERIALSRERTADGVRIVGINLGRKDDMVAYHNRCVTQRLALFNN